MRDFLLNLIITHRRHGAIDTLTDESLHHPLNRITVAVADPLHDEPLLLHECVFEDLTVIARRLVDAARKLIQFEWRTSRRCTNFSIPLLATRAISARTPPAYVPLTWPNFAGYRVCKKDPLAQEISGGETFISVGSRGAIEFNACEMRLETREVHFSYLRSRRIARDDREIGGRSRERLDRKCTT